MTLSKHPDTRTHYWCSSHGAYHKRAKPAECACCVRGLFPGHVEPWAVGQ